MKDKNIYNYKKRFPRPEVSVDEAWNNMHELLVKNNLTSEPKKEKRRWLIWLLLFLFIGLAGVIGYVSFNENATVSKENKIISVPVDKAIDTQKKSADNIIQTDSINRTLLKSDSNKPGDKNNLVNTLSLKTFHKNFAARSSSETTSVDKPKPANNKSDSYDSKDDAEHVNINKSPDDNMNVFTENNDSIRQSISSNNLPYKNDSTTSINNALHKKTKSTSKLKKDNFHFGLQWNINFALNNNDNYFNAYRNNNKQYYMWLLPSAWASMQLGKHQSVSLIINPYEQQYAGSKIVRIEKPFIQSVEPDIVTRLVKSRSINLGLNYCYAVTKKLSVNVGGNYSFQQNALYLEQSVESFSGNILSEKIYGARKKDEAFKYIKPSYLSFSSSLQYNFKKLSLGAGITSPLTNLSTDKQYNIKPLNGELFLRYQLK